MTFLEFVFHELLDAPAYGSAWHCPWCDPNQEEEWVSLSVRPELQRPDGTYYPIKFRCHRCGKWGDELDIVMKVLGVSKATAKIEVAELLNSYMREHRQIIKPPLGETKERGRSSLSPNGASRKLTLNEKVHEAIEEQRKRRATDERNQT